MSRCATCGQDDTDPCGHLVHDPQLTPEAQRMILRQSLFLAKPQPPADNPNKQS
jgi:hypothetical protein